MLGRLRVLNPTVEIIRVRRDNGALASWRCESLCPICRGIIVVRATRLHLEQPAPEVLFLYCNIGFICRSIGYPTDYQVIARSDLGYRKCK
jgi:hypothetical protein